jgi:hypothetical protein
LHSALSFDNLVKSTIFQIGFDIIVAENVIIENMKYENIIVAENIKIYKFLFT